MGVVAKERHIGEDRDRHGGDDDKRGRGNAAGEGKPRRHLQPGRKQHRQREDHAGKPAQIDPVERLQRLKQIVKKARVLGRQVVRTLLVAHRCASPHVVRKSASMLAVTK